MKKMLLAIAVLAVTATMAAVALAHPRSHARAGVTADKSDRASSSCVDIAYALARGPDGKLVVGGLSSKAGDEIALARYTLGGGLDLKFGTGGTALANFRLPLSIARAMTIQPDGKIVVVGGGGFINGSGFELARFTAEGKLDRSFGRGGRVLTRFGSGRGVSFGTALAIQADGKLVAAGTSSDSTNGSPAHFTLARYTRGGALDPSFGAGGKVVVDSRSSEYANALAVGPDGTLVVAGTSFAPGTQKCAVARFTASGKLDPSFGTSGRVLTVFGYSCEAAGILTQPDGKIVIAGSVASTDTGGFMLARYSSDGTLDPSFGAGGRTSTDFDYERSESANALAIQPDGRLVAAGAIYGTSKYDSTRFALARYTTAGALDPSFGDGGKVITDLGSSPRTGEHQATARAVAIQPDGKIVAAGSSLGDFALTRYTSDGNLDPNFGRGGKVTTAFGLLWRTKLASLTATRINRDVLVRWRTASELDARGFNVYRDEGAGRRRANRSLIRAYRRPGHGATYSFRDPRPSSSIRRYRLQEVTVDGTYRWLRQVAITR
jgi:uncharacterized delta-60 repeat protein